MHLANFVTNMTETQWNTKIEACLDEYVVHVRQRMDSRNAREVPTDFYEQHIPTVLAGLLARQATLTIKLSQCPPLWDGHIATIILRSMVECLVTFRWVVMNPNVRAAEYVSYGLGQARLALSHLQREIEAEVEVDRKDRLLMAARSQEGWIVSQKLLQFVDVNLGSWSGTSIRKMCEEIGDTELYHFFFVPFSASTHSTWQHVSIWNTKLCKNPLHMEHRVSSIASSSMDLNFVSISGQLFDRLVFAFDEYYGIVIDDESSEAFFQNGLLDAFEDEHDDKE